MKKIFLTIALLNIILCLFGGTVLCNFQSHGSNINIDYTLRCYNGSSYQSYDGYNIAVNPNNTTTENVQIATGYYPVQLEAWQSNSVEPIFTINHFVIYAGNSWTSDVLTVNAIAVYLRLQAIETSVTAYYTLHCDDNSTYSGYNVNLSPIAPTLVYIPINADTYPTWLEVDGSSVCGHTYITTNEFEFDQVPELMNGYQYWWNGHDNNGTWEPLYVQGYPYENVILYVYSNIEIEDAEITYSYDVPLETEITLIGNLKKGWTSFRFDDVGLSNAEAEAVAVGVEGENCTFDSIIELVYNPENDCYENDDIEFCFENKPLHDDWNWESFPKLTVNSTTNNGPMNFVPSLVSNIDPDGYDWLWLDGKDLNDLEYDGEYNLWTPAFYVIWSTVGVKIKLDSEEEARAYISDGTRVLANTEIELVEGWNWIGYWLPHSERCDVVFGEDWDKVNIIKAEDWYYDDLSIGRGGIEPVTPQPKPFHYGEGYMVKMHEAVTLTLQTSEGRSENFDKPESQYFDYEVKADYEVIDIVDVPQNITEIGVYEDETCVGAVVVQDSSVQILIYSETANREPVPFNFEIITGRGSSTPIRNYEVYNFNNSSFEPGLLISQMQDYSLVRLGEEGEPQNDISVIDQMKLHGNYPNPFNPETNISFLLPIDQNIELIVYNLKGQKVRQLVSGQFASGLHSVTWDGKDNVGKNVGSGLYFYKLITKDQELSKKMLLLK